MPGRVCAPLCRPAEEGGEMALHVHATNRRRLSDSPSPRPPGTAPEVHHPSSCHTVVGLSTPGHENCCCEAVPGLYPPFGLFSGDVAAIDRDSQRGSHGCTPGCQRGQAPSCGVSGVQRAIQRAGGTWTAPLAARLGHICTPKPCPVRAGSSIAAQAATSPPEGGRVSMWGWGADCVRCGWGTI